jgi:TolA-binding protein
MTSPDNNADKKEGEDDKLALALRSAIDAEAPSDPAEDDAILARAIARATARLETPAAKEEEKDEEDAAPAPIPFRRPAQQAPQLKLKRRSSSRALKIAIPLAAAFAASLALAGAYVVRQSQHPPPHQDPTANPRPALPPPPPPQPATPSEVGISVNDLPTAATTSPMPPSAQTTASAADLFRDANAERRNGNVVKASELYRALQKQHPSSAEAQASHVSLGRLLLDKQGDPAGALNEFDAYLKGTVAVADGGTLAEEARVGRAMALQHLGRTDEERRAWEDLIQRHPSSLHVARARDRLNQLDRH